MASAGLNIDTLDRSMRAARIESDEIMNDFITTRSESFRLAQKYLEAEIADTKELEKMIDQLAVSPKILSENETIPFAQFVSQTPHSSDVYLDRYQAYVDTKTIPPTSLDLEEADTNDLVSSIRGKMRRLADTSVLPDTSSASLASGYSPNLQGIYILTPSGIQTRLFDYIDPLVGTETTDVVDIDQDGDQDYITLMDGALYVKYSHALSPSKIIDTSLQMVEGNEYLVPSAPNFFIESVAAPGKLHLSFAPARSSDTSFRLEFFDRYIEWDHVAIGLHDENIHPRSIIDFATLSPSTTTDSMSVTPVDQVLGGVSGDPTGFVLQGQKVSIIYPGESFTLTAGRPIYTGKSQTRLVYDTATETGVVLQLKPWTKYVFHSSISGNVSQGKLYTFQSSSSERVVYSDDLIGMPLLDGMKVQNTAGSFSVYNTRSKESTILEENALYQYQTLGNPSDTYTVTVSYEDGFYFSRLRATSQNGELSDVAGVTLLAPQKSLDTDAPIVDIPQTIRVPVYQKKEFITKDVITDVSEYTIQIDPDITGDENRDGIFDNDFTQKGDGVEIRG